MNTELIEKVLSLYESSLEIPTEKPKNQFLLCPVGLVGSGKTTVIKPLCARLSLLRLSTDEVRKIIYNLSATVTLEEFSKIMTTLFKKYLSQGYSIAIDADCASAITQNLIQERQRDYNLKVVWIHVAPGEDFIINKLRNYSLTHNETWLFKNADEAVKNYMARKDLHKNLTMPFVYTFDTSLATLGNQIDEAVDVIKKEVDQ